MTTENHTTTGATAMLQTLLKGAYDRGRADGIAAARARILANLDLEPSLPLNHTPNLAIRNIEHHVIAMSVTKG
jgi:hypothetical protein